MTEAVEAEAAVCQVSPSANESIERQTTTGILREIRAALSDRWRSR